MRWLEGASQHALGHVLGAIIVAAFALGLAFVAAMMSENNRPENGNSRPRNECQFPIEFAADRTKAGSTTV